ncbi:MAG: response regulator [Verrucomicrobiae bacterium]|nr:response regulator [Verrucomicrobiae bacterium]
MDDDEAIVFITSRVLERLGYQVTGLLNAQVALQQFEASPDAFDVVVTDLSMPGLSGIELASELRRIRPDVPMVLTSGCIRPEDLEMATRLGRTEVVGKPSPPEELDAVLRRLLESR